MTKFSKFAALRLSALLSLMGVAAVVPAVGQRATAVVDSKVSRHDAVLPKQFGKWVSGGGPSDESKIIAADTPVSQEAGRTGQEFTWYSDGKRSMRVLLETFRDPSGAYQIFTARLSTNVNPSTVAPLTAAVNDQLIALAGNCVVTIWHISSATDADLKLLLDSVKQNADRTPLPPIRAYLPNEQMVQGTQRYALGPAGFNAALEALNEKKFTPLTPEIGFPTGAEAMLAKYVSPGNKTQDLLIIEYPTPQLAEQRLHHIQTALSANPDLGNLTFERRGSLVS